MGTLRLRTDDDPILRGLWRDLQVVKQVLATVEPQVTNEIRSDAEKDAVAAFLLATQRGTAKHFARQYRQAWRLIEMVAARAEPTQLGEEGEE